MNYKKCCRNCEYAYLESCKSCSTFGDNAYENFELRKELAKIESGKLVELPCPLGSTVYVIEETRTTSGKFVFGQIEECIFDSEEFDFDSLRDFGNTIFTTKEAAEAKLARLKNAD